MLELPYYRGVAQMVACLNGVQEALSSNLSTPTKEEPPHSLEQQGTAGVLLISLCCPLKLADGCAFMPIIEHLETKKRHS